MLRHQGLVLLRCVFLLVLSGGSSALPNRASVRDTQYDTTDNNNTNKYTNKEDSLGFTERIPKLQDNSGTVRRVLRDPGPLCAYRTLGADDPETLCFRYAQPDFRCASASCQQVSSPGGQLTANILSNGSVFIQWTVAPPKGPAPDQTGGFRLSCWWNGSYTQFECAAIHLGAGCRDYLLNELHANVPYRLCVRPYAFERDDDACVEFSFAASEMQDIVIAMTTVGGAICVMLVIICLLVAYITENIMNPTAQHSQRSHLHTHL